MTNSARSVHLPMIGVVVTSYNYKDYVEDAIRSVLSQTYSNWECVVIDDASTDGSAEHIRQLLETIGDPRFRLIARSTNGGQLVGFRDGYEATSAPFIAFLDSDDIWLPDFLRAHVAAHMSASHAAAVSCSDVFLIDGSRSLLTGNYPHIAKAGRQDRPGWKIPSPPPDRPSELFAELEDVLVEPIVYWDVYTPGWIWSPTSAMVFRRGALDVIFSFQFDATKGHSDYLVANCAHIIGGSMILSESFGFYRRHSANLSSGFNYAGGSVWLTENQWAYTQVIEKNILDFAIANNSLLGRINGAKFVRQMIKSLFSSNRSLADFYLDNTAVRRILGGRDRWWWFRKRIQLRFRRMVKSLSLRSS